MKRLIWTAGIAAVLGAAIVAAWIVLPSQLETLIATAVEDYASARSGTRARVDNFSLSLSDSSGTLNDLTIDNPPGFDTKYALQVGHVEISIKANSLARDVLRVNDIVVSEARLYAEQIAQRSNLTEIYEHIRNGEAQADAGSEIDGRIAIEKFELRNARMIIVTEALSEPEEVELEPIVLTNLGSPADGLTYGQATEEILNAIFREARRAMAARVGDAARDAIERDIESSLRKRIDQLSD